jgi:NTE family protein
LVFSGGGARGAYEAGVVRFLLEELPRRLGHPVRADILCGTSVGAIHACFLGATADGGPERGRRLVELWTSMRVEEVLPLSARDLLKLPRRLLGLRRAAERMREGPPPDRLYGLFDTRPLEKVVREAIPWHAIRRQVKAGRVEAVCIPATQIATGRVVIFMEVRSSQIKSWSRDPTIVPRITRLTPAHALASAAIPVLFPAVRVGSTYYADGGLRLNTPLSPALRLGADRVLVVSLRQSTHQSHEAKLAQARVEDYANPTFLFGKMLNALLLDHLDADLARMRVMNEMMEDGEATFGPDFMERLNETARRDGRQGFRRVRELVIRPSADLGVLAGQILESMPAERRRSPLLRLAARNLSQGQPSHEADLLSYLLFDGEFLRPLTELGFRDAKAREEELCAFFSDET